MLRSCLLVLSIGFFCSFKEEIVFVLKPFKFYLMKSNPIEVKKSVLVMRLERNEKDLSQLRHKLNSYTCEPRTPSLFERMEVLRGGLEALCVANKEIMTSLKEGKRSLESYWEPANKHLLAFNQLQQGVEEYVAGARNC